MDWVRVVFLRYELHKRILDFNDADAFCMLVYEIHSNKTKNKHNYNTELNTSANVTYNIFYIVLL